MKHAIALLILFAITFPSSTVSSASANPSRGSIIKVERLETMSQSALQAIAADFPGVIKVQNGADLYRVSYWTVLKGKSVKASGLFSVPQGISKIKGVVMFLHGTNMTRSLSPSQADRADGNEETAVFAGNHYLIVLPDYIGLGISTEIQAYVVTKPQVDASVDLLRAVRKVAGDMKLGWSPSLYMMGFSQGGQTVAGVHRELEQRPLSGYRLKGSIGVAGPYELRKTSLPKFSIPASLQNYNVAYLAFAAYAYASYYDHALGKVFAPELVGIVPHLFDGTKSAPDIITALPNDARNLFRRDFLRAVESTQGNWFTTAMEENESFAWAPKRPFRLYFGDIDLNVSPEASKKFYNYAKSNGGNISLHSLGPVDHQTSAAMAYAPALVWFDTLSNSR